MRLSQFGERLTAESGILDLMEDLGKAMAGGEHKYMLGGGNPAHIPEVNSIWRSRMSDIIASGGDFDSMLVNYDTPRGNERFLDALAGLLNREFGWPVSRKNIAVTNGSQTAFFFLINMLTGPYSDGSRGRILFPLMPEYIGYADQALFGNAYSAERSRIEMLDERTFKYRVDFESLEVPEDVVAICVSRPTNPTGNVLTDGEVAHLDRIARNRGIPLVIDSAYGAPFPQIIFESATPVWNENIVLALSLSKLGLPSVRTGIVVAREEIIQALSAVNAIASLATGSVGQMILLPMIESGEILRLSREVIRPYYLRKSRMAIEWFHEYLGDSVDYAIHSCEGALFLWVWFKDLPITTKELYNRLKKRNVIVVPSRYFFFGLPEPWEHADQCIRVNYSQGEEDVRRGIELIAEEVRGL